MRKSEIPLKWISKEAPNKKCVDDLKIPSQLASFVQFKTEQSFSFCGMHFREYIETPLSKEEEEREFTLRGPCLPA